MATSLKLAQKLFLENDGDENVACSPLSLDGLLCLLASGSSGRTLDQLKAALSCHDRDMINSMASRIMAVASNTSTQTSNHEIQNPSPNLDHNPVQGQQDQSYYSLPLQDNRVQWEQNHGYSVPAWDQQVHGYSLPLVWDDRVQLGPPREYSENGGLIDLDPFTQPTNQQVDGLIISFINGIWVDKKFPLKETFREVASDVHKAQVQSVDIENQCEEVRIEINKWVEKSTSGMIKDLVKKDMIKPETTMVLANALYFKGLWSTCFNKEATKPKRFYLQNGGNHKVPFMTNKKPQFFKSFDSFKLLKLPYESNSHDCRCFSMYIFLPHERDGLRSLAQRLTSDPHQLMHQDYELWKEKLDEFWVPRFKFSCEMNDVGGSFAELGLTLPFNAFAAELTEICNDRLFVSKMIHKCVIEVSEEGTEAAAVATNVTSPAYGSMYYEPPPKPSFVADHPFLFMIREDGCGAIFFIGAVLDPRKP